MFHIICIRRVMALAIISHLKASNWSTPCDAISHARWLRRRGPWGSTPPAGMGWSHSVKLRTPLRLGWGDLPRLAPFWISLHHASHFSFVSRNYMISGLFSWCKLFLIAQSFIFSLCSKSGMVNLSCTTQKSFRCSPPLIQKEKRNPSQYDGYRSTKGSMHRKMFSLDLREISQYRNFFRTFSLFPRQIFTTMPKRNCSRVDSNHCPLGSETSTITPRLRRLDRMEGYTAFSWNIWPEIHGRHCVHIIEDTHRASFLWENISSKRGGGLGVNLYVSWNLLITV